jgi:hypothetical protein
MAHNRGCFPPPSLPFISPLLFLSMPHHHFAKWRRQRELEPGGERERFSWNVPTTIVCCKELCVSFLAFLLLSSSSSFSSFSWGSPVLQFDVSVCTAGRQSLTGQHSGGGPEIPGARPSAF